ncbi:hypothetical protein FRX31_010554 [Thalictrum thalictroides]|uniref:Uncharacterized protein n=1 Tax=Thalictrum thalictroides TaxID=46969 RepID=A0A7J6WSB9_THATH|nr:hypothetical protein FRX31_010554 [Thalictrum thalictroides]
MISWAIKDGLFERVEMLYKQVDEEENTALFVYMSEQMLSNAQAAVKKMKALKQESKLRETLVYVEEAALWLRIG